MPPPDLDAPLQIAPATRIDFRAPSAPAVTLGVARTPLGAHGLALLDAFRVGSTITDALARLKPRLAGSLEWVECLRLATRLQELGILVPLDRSAAAAPHRPGFASPPIHIAMLDDRSRMDAFLQAIRQTVRPGDTVVDIGTGTGVLAVAAAKAGATKVYAIEQTEISDAAQGLFEANGVADRIELLRDASTRIELPDRADVVVGEIFGHDPLDENVLESFLDARQRHLKPGGTFLPQALSIHAVAVELPDDILRGQCFTPPALAAWSRAHEIDFTPLLAWQRGRPDRFLPRSEAAKRLIRRTRSIRFPEIHFASLASSLVDFQHIVEVTTAGRIDGVQLWFELCLAPGLTLTTDPEGAGNDNHWRTPVHLRGEPLNVKGGQSLSIRYENGRHGASSATVNQGVHAS